MLHELFWYCLVEECFNVTIPIFRPHISSCYRSWQILGRGIHRYGTAVSLFLAVFSQRSDVFFRVRDGLRLFSHRSLYPRGEYPARSLYWDRIRVRVRRLLTLMRIYDHRVREIEEGSGRLFLLGHFWYVSRMVWCDWLRNLHSEMLLRWRHHSQTRDRSLLWRFLR